MLAACLPAWAADPLLPHVYRSGLSLGPYGGTVSRAVTYWKGVVYVSVDAETCRTGEAASAYTLYAVDARDPDHLRYLSRGGEGGCKANGLVVWEDTLYVAHWFRFLTVWDVAVPGAFNLMSEYRVPDQATWSIDAFDDRVYLGMGIETLKSFYIMDRADPVEISHTDWMGGTAVRGSYSFYTDGPWFKVLNISDERNPWDMAAVNAGGNVGEVVLRDHYAFVKLGWPPDPATGMVIYDIANPTQPVEIGRWTAGDSYGFRGIYLLGDLAFLPTSGNGVFTVDISNLAAPLTRSQFEVPYYSLELALTGNGPFLYVGTAENGGGVHCFQVLTGDPDDAGPGRWSGCSLGEASWDYQYEGDALPPAADPGWVLVEGSPACATAAGGVLRINDNSSASGSKVKWARNWNASNSRGTTVLARAKCASYSTGGGPLAYLGNIYVRDGRFAEEFSILSDRARAVRANREYLLDGTKWHTYRITTRDTQFQLFVDEEAAPALTGPLFADHTQDPAAAWARVMIGSGSSAGQQDISFDYVYCFTGGTVSPPPRVRGLAPTLSVRVADTAGKGSLSGINPATARVMWSTDAGTSWNSGDGQLTVTCTPVSTFLPMDRGEIVASHIPFNQASRFLNKVRFSVQDMAGNVGLSPVYTVRNGSMPDFDIDGDVDQSDFAHLQACLSDEPIASSSPCEDADFDGDGYCGSSDLEAFQACMGGPELEPRCPG